MYKWLDNGNTFVDIEKKYVEVVMAVVMLTVLGVIFFGVSNVAAKDSKTIKKSDENKYIVVLDAGHGGKDPGKIGVNGSIERDINLAIVKKLQIYLEENDIKVVLTRQDENGLYSDDDTNKKRSDMEKRCEIINEIKPDLMVSIHQNSYSSEGVKGAQVFYYKNSYNGEMIASIIQRHLVEEVDKNNGRQHKDNNIYYILKNVSCPAVLVECGFLSNYSESELLVSEEYQEKLAVAIGNGILEYLEKR